MSTLYPLKIYPIWREVSAYSVEEAAYLSIERDPDSHHERYYREDEYRNWFDQAREGGEAFVRKVRALVEAIESGDLTPVQLAQDENGNLDIASTRLLKADVIRWWRERGLIDLANQLDISSVPDSNDKNLTSTSSNNNTDHSVQVELNELALKYRGCKRVILQNWINIRSIYGPKADGKQVLRFINNNKLLNREPELKTVQNCLWELKKKKLLP